ncbi:hypothetical protein KV557_00860 [Kitasatospora aureofaciens]|uniref:hypothetical protein n=1 Tax=Kitasatospora aureofaciens TaxID=1894 RepID=UPI001C476515|nr:hypothetical protein [Kitasatospora aureofaciens]MBV6695673.1 hypothetical protein [Kitasatospora aureofaciens]
MDHTARPAVVHPAGHDGDLRAAVEELRSGRWVAAREVLARSRGDWPQWTRRTQVLGAVAAQSDVLRHWSADEPDSPILLTLHARASVEGVLLAHQQQADERLLAGWDAAAREACWRAAGIGVDPVPWICLLALAQLDIQQERMEHRVDPPDQMLLPGPWGLLEHTHRIDPWGREAYHRMLRFWLAMGRTGAATNFLMHFLASAPTGSALHALPLHLHLERYRREPRKEAVLSQWSSDHVRRDVQSAYTHWRAAVGEHGRWPVADESLLAHALWADHHLAEAAEVFASLGPFASWQPWATIAGDRERGYDLLHHAIAQCRRVAAF